VTDEIKSQRVKSILGDPVFLEVMEAMRDTAVDAWEHAPTIEAREQHWHRIKAIKMLRADLESIAIDGDVSRWNRRLRKTQT
jgi:hypothetical protein